MFVVRVPSAMALPWGKPMGGKLICWRCGASLKEVARPFPRLAKCKACDADLHVCRLCRHYDPRVSGRCVHELAVPAREVDVANFCQYFKPMPGAFARQEAAKARSARARLEALFDGDGAPRQQAASSEDEHRVRLESLFKGGDGDGGSG